MKPDSAGSEVARGGRRALDWRTLVGGPLLCLFGLWALWMVQDAAELRALGEEQVKLLQSVQVHQHAVMTNDPESARVADALGALERAAGRAPAVAWSDEHAQAIRDAADDLAAAAGELRRVLGVRGERDLARTALVQAVNRLESELWADNGALHRALEQRWISVQGLAAAAILIAALCLLVLLWVRERQVEAEAMQGRLRGALEQADEARKEALQASQAKSDFLATVSHEIRTPMTAVLGTVELLGLTPLSEDQRDLVAVINGGGQALLNVINDVLDLSRIEADRLELELRRFDLHALLEGLVLLFAVPAESEGLALSLFIDGDVPRELRGDPTRVRQVLVNLVGNAIKFTEAGEVEVRATMASFERVRFSVRDTGPGLAPEAHERVFEAFSQVDASTSRQHGGTGLGLAISRRLVEAMGGRLSVESALGEGATFTFTAALEPLSDAPSRFGREEVLVVGEGATARVVLEQLRAWGVETSAAPSAQAAAALMMARGPFDLVVCDLQKGEAAALRGLGSRVRQVGAFTERRAEGGGLSRPIRPSLLRRALRLGEDTEPPPSPPARPFDGVAPKVLVVDDNATNRLVVGRLLKALGCEVDEAKGGAVALERVSSERYDLVLMDFDMPEMDGLQATEHIRAQGGAMETLIIAGLTGHATDGARQAGMDAGMNDYLAKPVRLAQLRELLVRHGLVPEE